VGPPPISNGHGEKQGTHYWADAERSVSGRSGLRGGEKRRLADPSGRRDRRRFWVRCIYVEDRAQEKRAAPLLHLKAELEGTVGGNAGPTADGPPCADGIAERIGGRSPVQKD